LKNKLNNQFITRLTEVNGEYFQIESPLELPALLAQFLKENRLTTIAIGKSIFSADEKQIISSQAQISIDFDLDDTPSQTVAVNIVGQADVGIIAAYGLIAETGSVVLRSQYQGDRLCSTLPEVNIIIWNGEIMYANSAEFYADIRADLTYTLITGPSRTADIEKTLVLGAHGPRRLVVFGR
jgi:L-lactate dehydrogenase complex protein LldG